MPISFRAIKPKGLLPKALMLAYGNLADAMDDFVVDARTDLVTYPPTGPSSYTRTGTLMRSWNSRTLRQPSRIEGVVGSQGQIAPYNRFVQGQQQKPLFKARGWKTPKDVLDKRWPELKKRVNRIMREMR